MPKPEVIEDYYGTLVEVETVFKSAGGFVYMDRHSDLSGGAVGSMDRFTPDQARNLATQLNKAADEVDPPLQTEVGA